jgi:hypothetical protein
LKELTDNGQANIKAHVTWASKVTKVGTLLLIFSFVSDVSNLPSYNISPTATLAEKMVCCSHKVYKLYNVGGDVDIVVETTKLGEQVAGNTKPE